MKTITYNPETHVLVPKGMVYELLGLPMPISKGEFSKDLFDGFQMHPYTMRYLDEAIAAAPQPEPVDVEPVGYVDYGDRVEWHRKPVPETDLYTTPQPDRTAELEAERDALKEDAEWIDVNDRLPETEGTVLLCMGSLVGIGGFSKNFGWWGTGANFGDEDHVTHWKPLPKPPAIDAAMQPKGE